MSDEISEHPDRPIRGQVLFAALFLICALVLLAGIEEQTKWLSKKSLFSQPRFWPAVGVGGMVLFTGLHFWHLPRKPRTLPRWMREADWFQWAESLLWAFVALTLSMWVGPLHAAPYVALIATVRLAWLFTHWIDRREFKIWLSVFEWAAWFLAYVVLVPVLGYLPMTLLFAPLLTWRIGYRSRLMFWISIGFSLCVVLVFKSFLQVKIPGAAIYEYLPSALRSFFILNF